MWSRKYSIFNYSLTRPQSTGCRSRSLCITFYNLMASYNGKYYMYNNNSNADLSTSKHRKSGD